MAAHRIVEYVRPADPRLGRNVNHDPRSKQYPVRAPRRTMLKSVRHVRHVPVFDQGDLGSCTGNAALGCLGTGVFYATMDDAEVARWPWDQQGAVGVYSEATRIDPFAGQYPPTDTGSDGLSVAKVCKRAGLIAGYEHAFGLIEAVSALQRRPFITGTLWLSDMHEPDADGVVHPLGRVEGGHEYVGDEYVDVGNPFGPRARMASAPMIGFTNSWGTGWGTEGRFYMSAQEYGTLLAEQGDVTFFVPSDEVAPEPLPLEDPDAADAQLAAEVGPWARRNALSARTKRQAIVRWLDAKGL